MSGPSNWQSLDTLALDGLRINEAESDDEEDAFISIGIDFGTTYSGVAWALSTSPKDIEIISTWDFDLPSNSSLHKVPSILTYNSKGIISSWGYKLEAHRHFISWFKLALSDQGMEQLAADQPARYKELQALMSAYGKTPVDVAADYLRCLWAHATETIQTRLGKHLWENLELRIVLTVPAIWDHKAQEATRKAAQMAGLLSRSNASLELIGEPEAATLAVFNEMESQRKRMLKTGDSFVVCDCGGGTVDLISYTIEKVKPLALAMSTESTGGLCGAIFLDGAFEKQIRTMLSATDYNALTTRAKRKVMNEWEYGIKRSYRVDAAENRKWYIDIPGYSRTASIEDFQRSSSPVSLRSLYKLRAETPISGGNFSSSSIDISSNSNLDSNPGALVLRTGHLNAIFGEVCDKIKDLVSEQVAVVKARSEKDPSAILLIGGFGESVYLKQDLERSFKGIEVQQPTKAWTAICRGAVLKGLGHLLVVNHISKYNYGIAAQSPFDEAIHDPKDKVLNTTTGNLMASDQMHWFLRRGENIYKTEPVVSDFHFNVKSASSLKDLELPIYYSDSLEAEDRVDANVKLLCKLAPKFPTSLFEKLRKRTNSRGEEYRVLPHTVELQVTSGQLCWVAKHELVPGGVVRIKVGYEGVEQEQEP